jgi:lipopolysaccharide transport system ATP-binding protein
MFDITPSPPRIDSDGDAQAMDLEPVIVVANVSKTYRIWAAPAQRLMSSLYGLLARLAPAGWRTRFEKKAAAGYQDFPALRGVSLEVRKGQAVGIIGRNGSGKSTLLQIIAGTLQPTEGTVKVNGRVAALLELGSGFNPDFTGRENVFLNGAILGFSRHEMEQRFPRIAAFADIGDFIEQPVKVYSSGMMVRLAFAVQTAVDPDVLIVDEALSVGDFFFAQKCMARIRELAAGGTSILFVSHDVSTVRDLCQKCLYLRKGRPEFWGESQHAVHLYLRESTSASPSLQRPSALAEHQAGSGLLENFLGSAQWVAPALKTPKALRIRAVRFLNEQDEPAMAFRMGGEARFDVLVTAESDCVTQFMLTMTNRYDQIVTCQGTYTAGMSPRSLAAGETVIVRFAMTLLLEAGQYALRFGASTPGTKPNQGSGHVWDATPKLGPIDIRWDYENEQAPFLGLYGPPTTVDVTAVTS